MKRIIAFVLFALMIYAGGVFLVYGFKELEVANSHPLPLNLVSSSSLTNGQLLEGKVYQQVKHIETDTIQPDVLGIPYGKRVERRFYLVPFRYEEEPKNTKYYIVCLSAPESIEQMEQLGVTLPKPEEGDGLEITGVAQQITVDMKSLAYNTLINRTRLVGVDGFLRRPLPNYYYDRILPWIVYERRSFGSEWIVVAIGAALLLGGIIPSVILIVRIRRERY